MAASLPVATRGEVVTGVDAALAALAALPAAEEMEATTPDADAATPDAEAATPEADAATPEMLEAAAARASTNC